jgi:DNA-binding transcriptional regulator YiaG
MSPGWVRRARKRLGLSQSQFAALLGVHPVTVKKWETGAQNMRAPVERLIRLLVNRIGQISPAPRKRVPRRSRQ